MYLCCVIYERLFPQGAGAVPVKASAVAASLSPPAMDVGVELDWLLNKGECVSVAFDFPYAAHMTYIGCEHDSTI